MSKEDNTQEDPLVSPNKEVGVKEVAKINAIRDIIFGTDMAEYNEQFDSLKNEIAENKQAAENDKKELLGKISDLENSINNSLESLEKKLVARLDQLQNEKTDREVLGSLLEEIGKKIKQ